MKQNPSPQSIALQSLEHRYQQEKQILVKENKRLSQQLHDQIEANQLLREVRQREEKKWVAIVQELKREKHSLTEQAKKRVSVGVQHREIANEYFYGSHQKGMSQTSQLSQSSKLPTSPQELEELLAKIEEIELVKGELLREVERVVAEREGWENKFEELDRLLAAKDTEVTRMEVWAQEKQRETKEMKKELKKVVTELTRKSDRLTVTEDKYYEVQAQLKAVQQQLAERRKNQSSNEQHLSSLQLELAQCKQRIQTLSDTYSQSQLQHSQLQRQHARLQHQQSLIQPKLQSLTVSAQQMSQLKQRCEQLEDSLIEYKTKVEFLAMGLSKKEEYIKELQEGIMGRDGVEEDEEKDAMAVAMEKMVLEEEMEKLKAEMAKVKADYGQARQSLNKHKQELSSERNANIELQQILRQLTDEKERLKSVLSQQKSDYQSQVERLIKQAAQNSQYRQQSNSLRQLYESQRTELLELTQKHANLSTAHNQLSREHSKMARQHSQLTTQYSKAIEQLEQLEASNSSLTQINGQLTNQTVSLGQQLQTAKQSIERKETLLQASKQAKAQLEEKLNLTANKLVKARDESEALKRKLKAIQEAKLILDGENVNNANNAAYANQTKESIRELKERLGSSQSELQIAKTQLARRQNRLEAKIRQANALKSKISEMQEAISSHNSTVVETNRWRQQSLKCRRECEQWLTQVYEVLLCALQWVSKRPQTDRESSGNNVKGGMNNQIHDSQLYSQQAANILGLSPEALLAYLQPINEASNESNTLQELFSEFDEFWRRKQYRQAVEKVIGFLIKGTWKL